MVKEKKTKDNGDKFAMTLRLPQWKAAKITALADRLGHTTTAMIGILLDYGLDFFDEKPLQYYALVAGRFVVIYDRAIHQQVQVEIVDGELLCHHHLSGACEHCEFAKRIPHVKGQLAAKNDFPPP